MPSQAHYWNSPRANHRAGSIAKHSRQPHTFLKSHTPRHTARHSTSKVRLARAQTQIKGVASSSLVISHRIYQSFSPVHCFGQGSTRTDGQCPAGVVSCEPPALLAQLASHFTPSDIVLPSVVGVPASLRGCGGLPVLLVSALVSAVAVVVRPPSLGVCPLARYALNAHQRGDYHTSTKKK